MERLSLQWSYMPTDYFALPLEIETPEARISIANGRIEAEIKLSTAILSEPLIKRILQAVEDVFIADQLFRRRQYVIEGYSIQKEMADGKKEITAFLKSGVISFSGEAHTVLTDASGKVLKDSKVDQVEKAKATAKQISVRNRDILARSILESFQHAISDAKNELIHYYEVLDSLRKHFGSEKNARNTLGIAQRTWDAISKLANSAPILQGRHRGLHFGKLRNATEQELTEARQATVDIITRYLNHIK